MYRTLIPRRAFLTSRLRIPGDDDDNECWTSGVAGMPTLVNGLCVIRLASETTMDLRVGSKPGAWPCLAVAG